MLELIARTLFVWLMSLLLTITSLFGLLLPASAAPILSSPVVIATGGLFSFAGKRPTILGVYDGELTPCPNSPNCVSSQSQESSHQIDPLPYEGTPEAAIARLKTVIEALPRTEIIESTGNYLYAEFTSAVMGFVDDVEFYADPNAPIVHVRSASRLGESDLGVNRKRIELIRKNLSGLG